MAIALALTGPLAACSTPSARYGLPPPAALDSDYPNINLDPAKAQTNPALSAEERARAEVEMQKRVGVRPKLPPAGQ